ncbi:hypothetical protein [Mesorhizobium sp. M1312]
MSERLKVRLAYQRGFQIVEGSTNRRRSPVDRRTRTRALGDNG